MQNSVTLTNRSVLNIIGAEKVIGVSTSEIVLETNQDTMVIKGENMEVKNLDVDNKVLNVNGLINSIKYLPPKISFVKRIFK